MFKSFFEDDTKVSDKNIQINKIDEVNEYFKLPIFYNKDKVELKQTITNDLELLKTVDGSSNPIYHYYFNTDNDLSKKIIDQTANYYTTDTNFLKNNQKILQDYKKIDKYTNYSNNYSKIIEIWNDIKCDTGFKEKYYYIDWPMWEFLNKSEYFLQMMSIYNMASPIISLFVPIIILIVPFFIIRLKGLTLTINEYIDVLKIIASQHAIGRLFTSFNNVSVNEKLYLLFSAVFYLFSIYQNILTCIRFNSNMLKIHNDLKEIKNYLDYTVNSMENYLKYTSNMETHREFNILLSERMNTLTLLKQRLSYISDYNYSLQKVGEIGHVLKYFYEIYDNKIYNDAIMYSFGFNGYLDCIEGLMDNIEERKVNYCKFISSTKKNTFKENYYAILKDENPIKNTIKLDKNIIITGPNASGKTTVIKSTLINVILTQQFGCGFYSSAKFCPYKFIHCYLNIPDTSGRDSLFQAEARRCKEIIDIMNSHEGKKETHYCSFDELYSGTNPEEAVTSATAFMEYITKKKNVSCILTTHFIKVCKNLEKKDNIKNCHMVTQKENNKIIYKYLLKEGISEVKGGINVLYDMNYPKEIIENTLKHE